MRAVNSLIAIVLRLECLLAGLCYIALVARLMFPTVAVACLLAGFSHAQQPDCYYDQYGRRICPLQQQGQQYQRWEPRSPLLPVERAPVAVTPPPQVVRLGNTVNGQTNLGSGTLVDGGILTCGHLFEPGVGSIAVMFPGDTFTTAELIELDHDNDLAFLAIESAPVDPLPISSAAPQIGDIVECGGYGGPPRTYATSTGKIKQFVRLSERMPQLQSNSDGFTAIDVTGSARQGDSGGPMFNQAGELVGVISGTDGKTVTGPCCVVIDRFVARCRGLILKRLAERVERIGGRMERIGNRRGGTPARPINQDRADIPGPVEDDYTAPQADNRPTQPSEPQTDLQAEVDRLKRERDECRSIAAKLQGQLTDARNQPPKVVEVEKIVEKPVERIVEKVIEKPAATAKSGIEGIAVSAATKLAMMVGIPAAGLLVPIAWWLLKRRVKKRVTNSSVTAQPAGQPVSVTNYALSDAYATDLARKRQHEGMSIPQEALLAQLYKEEIAKLREGQTLGEQSLAKRIEENVMQKFLVRHGVRTSL